MQDIIKTQWDQGYITGFNRRLKTIKDSLK